MRVFPPVDYAAPPTAVAREFPGPAFFQGGLTGYGITENHIFGGNVGNRLGGAENAVHHRFGHNVGRTGIGDVADGLFQNQRRERHIARRYVTAAGTA